MTNEEKQLLLKELCTRMLYGVICTDLRHGDSKITEVDIEDNLIYCFDFDEWVKVENCRLYLRPMSSMTEEEKREYYELSVITDDGTGELVIVPTIYALKFFLFNHLDYQGLIPMGLAVEAPEDMYKTE